MLLDKFYKSFYRLVKKTVPHAGTVFYLFLSIVIFLIKEKYASFTL